ncbi:prepilin-type N-terminal cleavage/methylation domain-containing protein [Altericista sp. CCNU0014]|uniref:prepilin-type N-terminal cleavage/methylation domain-containing protein n=1 Tax=Altericista sp. CCNU0014 TaxID=3082949 RepID=UPI0038510D8F
MFLMKYQSHLMQGKLKRQTAQGFTMIEVVVGILLVSIFTAISMQAIVMATSIKIRGDEVADATRLIEQDIEEISEIANRSVAMGYDSASSKYTVNTASDLCNPGTDPTKGYAQLLKDQTMSTGLISSTTPVTKSGLSGTKTYSLVRTATVNSTVPYNILQINYQLFRGTTTTDPISTFYTEIIPGASFYCR